MSRKTPSKMNALIERYGAAVLVTTLTVFAIEMTVLIALLKNGVDMEPMIAFLDGLPLVSREWISGTTGTVALAYALSRLLKPFTFPLVLFLTPGVARVMGRGTGPA